jgi:hypothetical protein
VKPSPHDAWILGKLVRNEQSNGELADLAEPWRSMATHLEKTRPNDRVPTWQTMLIAREDRQEIILAIANVDSNGPQPEVPTYQYATLADVAKIISNQPWLWKGWIASGVLNALASDPGIGKTRFMMDLARRLWFGLPFPDGQPATLPKRTRTLWIQGDRNFAEMLQVARDFGLPEEAVVLGSSPDDPFGSLDLDDPAILAAIEARIKASGVPLANIDTVGMTTARSLSKPDEAREFFAPLLELCQRTGVALFGATHLSANKEALGRRIVEKARVVIKMTHPDPEAQIDRRRLWVDKSAAVKPAPMGITMGGEGNEYDFIPPSEPEGGRRRPGPPPIKLEDCKKWLDAHLSSGPARVKDVRSAAEAADISADLLYRAKAALRVEEFTIKGESRKWWKRSPVEVVGDPSNENSDNSDKPY